MGFIEQLVGLLRGPDQKSSREHVISLLRTFVADFPPAIDECHRPEFDLEKLLKSLITSSMEDDPDLHEVHIKNVLRKHNVPENIHTPPSEGFLVSPRAPPIWKFQFTFILSFKIKILVFKKFLLNGIFNDPPCGGYGYFLEKHYGAFFSNAQLSFKEVLTAKHIVFYMEHPKCNQKSANYTP